MSPPSGSAAACQILAKRQTSHPSVARYQYWGDVPPEYARTVFNLILSQWQQPRIDRERADVQFDIRRDGSVSELRVMRSSENEEFDLEAMRAIARAAINLKFPALPASYLADVLPMKVMFGDMSEFQDSTALASGRQQPPQANPNNLQPRYPRGLTATGPVPVTLTFEIDSDGRVDMSTVQVVASPHKAFTSALLSVLPKWRFTPAVVDCKKVRSPFRWTTTFRQPG
ncbi:MAG: TonB family protein [Gemmatimonadota bacterium]|nr:TonB family protein [Gemmatimonadota bacterium]